MLSIYEIDEKQLNKLCDNISSYGGDIESEMIRSGNLGDEPQTQQGIDEMVESGEL